MESKRGRVKKREKVRERESEREREGEREKSIHGKIKKIRRILFGELY